MELKRFSERLGHLQEEIEMNNVQAKAIVQHALSLGIKLVESDKLHKKSTIWGKNLQNMKLNV